MKNLIFIPIVGLCALCSCTTTQTLYNWKGYDDAAYTYVKAGDEKSTQKLITVYQKLIQSKGISGRPAPGICADYGYLLVKQGETEKGVDLLKKEIEYYPESAAFINRIISRIQ